MPVLLPAAASRDLRTAGLASSPEDLTAFENSMPTSSDPRDGRHTSITPGTAEQLTAPLLTGFRVCCACEVPDPEHETPPDVRMNKGSPSKRSSPNDAAAGGPADDDAAAALQRARWALYGSHTLSSKHMR